MPTRSVDSSINRTHQRPSAALPPTPQSATQSAASPLSQSPQVLGIWHLGQMIHSGPQSALYTAQPADAMGSPRFDYVLRTLPTGQPLIQRDQALAQIVRFVTTAAVVRHPNLIAVLDSSLQSATPYLTMPRLAGQTLQTWLARKEAGVRLPVAIWFVRQISQALAALHAAGLLHGDVTPQNVHLSFQGHATLLDLGFARPQATANGEFLGTPNYAAPECLEGQFFLASDIYSLGKLFMELVAHGEPNVIAHALLEPVADLIAQMLQPSPVDRPTVQEVTKRLMRLEFETLGEHIQPASPVQPAKRQAA